uniref:Uncharacterized protein n=1 Tax=Leptobrachium leishanense TaxID=445787 RepID=A0A8C5PEL2_9ANUR
MLVPPSFHSIRSSRKIIHFVVWLGPESTWLVMFCASESVMASVDLRDELTCSICLSIYMDPVTLTCGHSFCRTCIGDVLDTQVGSVAYKCPECREEFFTLVKNTGLRNIADSFRSTYPEEEEVRIFCTYCDSPVPAAKTCVHCEASLCDKHLKKHSKSEEHVLTEPTTSLENRKCSVHKKVLEYYCCEDAACICVSCSLAGDHRGHQVETLNEASEKKKKEKLRNILQKLTSQRAEAEKRVQNLEELRRQVQGKAAGVTERVTALIRDIRKQLEALEKRVLGEISRQEEQVSLRVSDLIQQLEIKEELSRKMGDIMELCDMTDPLTVLQGRESDRADYCDAENTEKHDLKVHDVGDLDVGLISETLHSGLTGIVTRISRRRQVLEASDMLLDVNTAHNYVSVSEDLKTVSWSEIDQSRPETPERFQYYAHVLSSRSFSSGRHCWKVEGNESGWWGVGVVYPSMKRKGKRSGIGDNNKSWGLWRWDNNNYSVRHNNKSIQFPRPLSCCRIGIFLDYEAGRLSFYELCDPIRHLHTFTATFTEPLLAGFGVGKDISWVRIWILCQLK